jgi:hypothetical protein
MPRRVIAVVGTAASLGRAVVTPLAHGFTNMHDRLGALDRRLSVESTPGVGTTVRASIAARWTEVAGSRPDQPAAAGSRT